MYACGGCGTNPWWEGDMVLSPSSAAVIDSRWLSCNLQKSLGNRDFPWRRNRSSFKGSDNLKNTTLSLVTYCNIVFKMDQL